MSSPAPTPSTRLVSLDAFRGATIAGMLLVNNPGSWSHVYPPLLHAPWLPEIDRLVVAGAIVDELARESAP